MKRNRIRNLTALVLALVMIFALAACGQKQESEPTPTPAPEADASLPVNVMVLNGTTGFGMAGLISDSEAGNAALNYTFSVETDASNITAALVNGTADIGALPTNAAATLYN